jgi:hypothetical protein
LDFGVLFQRLRNDGGQALQTGNPCVKRPTNAQEVAMQLFRPILPGTTIIDRVVA